MSIQKNILAILISTLLVLPFVTTDALAQADVSYVYLTLEIDRNDAETFLNGDHEILQTLYLQNNNEYMACMAEATTYQQCAHMMISVYWLAYFLAINTDDPQFGMLNELNRITFLYGWCLELTGDLGACQNLSLAANGLQHVLEEY